MASSAESHAADKFFAPGNRCLLIIMKQRFLVSIQSVTENSIEVSFPVRDFPVEGMRVFLEFHDLEGYTRYESEVLVAPKEPGDFLVLRRPPDYVRNYHRGSWRVPVDFKAEVKGHVHPRRLHVPVVNLSTGGMLLLSDSAMEVDDVIESWLPIPELEGEKMTCKVVHRHENRQDGGLPQVGCAFISPDPTNLKVISNYIWDRIRALGPDYPPVET
ncbi:MAG: PilZ domain-containing protein [Candidatus Hydrogenedentes bacterium]|nr:PilZ domain-containing protein [Candidatus Hydrogenedentota bacterium]